MTVTRYSSNTVEAAREQNKDKASMDRGSYPLLGRQSPGKKYSHHTDDLQVELLVSNVDANLSQLQSIIDV